MSTTADVIGNGVDTGQAVRHARRGSTDERSFLRTGRGALTLALLLLVQFLDFLDVSITSSTSRS